LKGYLKGQICENLYKKGQKNKKKWVKRSMPDQLDVAFRLISKYSGKCG
jgi:hypothetical protein